MSATALNDVSCFRLFSLPYVANCILFVPFCRCAADIAASSGAFLRRGPAQRGCQESYSKTPLLQAQAAVAIGWSLMTDTDLRMRDAGNRRDPGAGEQEGRKHRVLQAGRGFWLSPAPLDGELDNDKDICTAMSTECSLL